MGQHAKKKKNGLRREAWIKGSSTGRVGTLRGAQDQAVIVGGEEGVQDSHPPR